MNSIKDWSAEERRKLRKGATAWFDSFGRDLPWRRTSDPYRIWVSEIMLQQTQVATVIPYYDRFLKSFPDVAALAEAPEESVLFHWAGLGYYRRAKQLHAAAKVVHHELQGVFPDSVEEVMRLPGIGRYTAGAILSFSRDVRAPIVEANTQRLYARLLALAEPLSEPRSQELLWKFADDILPKASGSGALNQAMMEIGSQVCLPRDPNCLLCPLRAMCPTSERGLQASIPAPKPPKVYTDLCEAAIIVAAPNQTWFMRRCEPDERWAGLWDFARFDITDRTQGPELIDHLEALFEKKYGFAIEITDEQKPIKHGVTKYRITLRCFTAQPKVRRKKSVSDRSETDGTGYFSIEPLRRLPLSSTGKKLLQRIEGSETKTTSTTTAKSKLAASRSKASRSKTT